MLSFNMSMNSSGAEIITFFLLASADYSVITPLPSCLKADSHLFSFYF